jgi:hypothetical protein
MNRSRGSLAAIFQRYALIHTPNDSWSENEQLSYFLYGTK